MKILMTTDAVGGVWTYALELCAALEPHGVEVVLATMGPLPSDAQRQEAQRMANIRFVTSAYKLEWMHEPWFDVARAGEWLLELADAETVDLIHLNGYSHAILPWKKPLVVVAHSCVYSWWLAVHGSQPPQAWEHYRHMVESGLKHASAVVAPTEAFLACLRQTYTFATPARVIPNSRNAREYRGSVKKEPFIFASGRLWDEAKNLQVLDAAAAGLAWPVWAAGDDTAPDGRCIVTRNLRRLGRRSAVEIASLLQRAEIFVHPALYEPFGLSVLEAAHAGCALVLADISTLRELWSEAALFVNPRDPAAIRNALQWLISADSRRRDYGERARERAQTFRRERTGGAYLSLYDELLHQPMRERSVA